MKETVHNFVGIDVGSKELVVKVEKQGQLIPQTLQFENTSKGHKALLKHITKRSARARVCLEATGIYHTELALSLSKAKNVEVMVTNPRAVKHFGMASMKRAKTDNVDADTILRYLKHVEFKPWKAPTQECLELQALSRRMFQLKNEIVRERTRLAATKYSDTLSKLICHDIEVNIRHVEKRITLLEEKAYQIVSADEEFKKMFDRLITIKGIAKTSAIKILAEILPLPDDLRPQQWVAFAGLDPRAFDSGTSIHRTRQISKAGNKYLRTALYMPALVASSSDPTIKLFYETLLARGKTKMQAIVAIMRKLLHCIWGMLKNETDWNSEMFYQPKKVLKTP